MAGFPTFVAPGHIGRLVKAGQRVVCCDQVDGDRNGVVRVSGGGGGGGGGGGTGLLKRCVTRIITPGTITEGDLLPRTHNWIAAIWLADVASDSGAASGVAAALAWVDVSTGTMKTTLTTLDAVLMDLARYPPVEVVIDTRISGHPTLHPLHAGTCTGLEHTTVTVRERGSGTCGAGSPAVRKLLESLGAHLLSAPEFGAVALALEYIAWTQQGKLPVLTHRRALLLPTLEIDSATARSLHLVDAPSGKARHRGSLVHCVDACLTSAGSRLLDARLRVPLACPDAITSRLDGVEWFVVRPFLRDAVRDLLAQCCDLSRCLQRVALNRASPRDLGAIRDTLVVVHRLGSLLLSQEVTDSASATTAASSRVWNDSIHGAVLDAAAMDFDDAPASDHGTVLRQLALAITPAAWHERVHELPNVLLSCASALLQPVSGSSPLAIALAELSKALIPEPPAGVVSSATPTGLSLRRSAQPSFVQAGYDAQLDELRSLVAAGDTVLAAMQEKYRVATSISSLKVRRTHMEGYSIEVPTKWHEALFRTLPDAVVVKTVKSGVRVTTEELRTLNRRVADAEAEAALLESAVFVKLCQLVLDASSDIIAIAKSTAAIDYFSALAHVAVRDGLTRPTIDRGSTALQIVRGRHMVVERALAEGWSSTAPSGNQVPSDASDNGTDDESADGVAGQTSGAAQFQRLFVPNDVVLPPFVCLVTGPNMGGKSTFLRLCAHAVVLAQIGSFVPAARMHFGLVDRLFSRVGSSDDISSDRSTFMVEMVETAAILKRATSRSFVVIDEIGKGTSTADGLGKTLSTRVRACVS